MSIATHCHLAGGTGSRCEKKVKIVSRETILGHCGGCQYCIQSCSHLATHQKQSRFNVVLPVGSTGAFCPRRGDLDARNSQHIGAHPGGP